MTNLNPEEFDAELMPVVAYVIHEIEPAGGGDAMNLWAWCRLSPDGSPGYQEIIAMKRDGVTQVAFPPGGLLGAVVTKLWC